MRPLRKFPIHIFLCLLFFQCVNVCAEVPDVSVVSVQPRTYEGEFDRTPKSPHSLGGHLVVSAGLTNSYQINTDGFKRNKLRGISGSVEFYFFDFFSLGIKMGRVRYATSALVQDPPRNRLLIETVFARITPTPGSKLSPYLLFGGGLFGRHKQSYVIEILDNEPTTYMFPKTNWYGLVGQMGAGLSFHLKSRLWARTGFVYTSFATFGKNGIFIPPLPFESLIVVGDYHYNTIDWSIELAFSI